MKPVPVLLLTGLAAVNLAAGYWIGQKSTSSRVQNPPPPAPVSIASAAPDAKLRDSIPMPSGLQGAGLAEILNAAGPLDRFQGIFAHVQNLPIEEIEAEILSVREQMQSGSMDPDRLFAMHLLMTRFGLEQPARAVGWLEGQDLLIRGFGTATVLSSLASKDPHETAKLFQDPDNPILKMPRVGSFAAIGVAREWSRTDPDGALAWAKSLPEESQGGAFTGIVGGMMAEDPVGATRTAMELPPGRDRERLLGNIAENWGTRDPAGALKWADSLEGMEKSAATKKVLHGWSNKDPEAAAAHLATLPAEERDDYTPSVAGRWANRNPQEAAAWVASQPEGPGRKEAVGAVMGTWAETEPEKASAWLVDQPDGPSKDQGIVTLANSQLKNDPEAALTWAATIGDPTTRSLQLKGNIRQWARRDAEAAAAWVETAPGLAPEERSELLPAQRPAAVQPAP